MRSDESGQEIFRARVHNLDTVPAAGSAIERLVSALGLTSLEASRFRFAVEELCAERIVGGFGAGESAEVQVILRKLPGEILVVVRDTGDPIDVRAAGSSSGGWLAHLTRRGFADELETSFRGRQGNRCEIVKFLAHHPVEVAPPAEKQVQAQEMPAIEYRDMTPEDAFEVTRCFFRTYGLTGPLADEIIYHPERLGAHVRDGLHLAAVAVLGDGRVIGHNAISRETVNDSVGGLGFLVVDPEFRGHGIGERVTELTFARGRAGGLHGLMAMAVTVHTASQKTSLKNGGVETGVLLAAQESRVVMRGIPEKDQHVRHSMMAYYYPLAPDIRRPSFPPAIYRDIVAGIYQACGLDRALAEPSPAPSLAGLPARTALSVSVIRGAHFAKIRVASFGSDFLAQIFDLMGDLHHHHIEVIRLELPLADPLTALFGSAAEELGFSFAAVFPCLSVGDLLCLQSLDRVAVDPATIHTASEHGRSTLDAVLASRERILSSATARTLEGARRALAEAGGGN